MAMSFHDCLVEHGGQFLQRYRLNQVMAKASFSTPLAISHRAIAAHGDGKLRTEVPHFPDQIPSVSVREANIGDQDIVIFPGNFLERLFLRASTPNGMSDVPEVET
jgi:hypothetical protein